VRTALVITSIASPNEVLDACLHALAQLDLSPGAGNIADSLLRCYRQMLRLGLIQDLEMELLKAWIDDVTAMCLG
jgi:hypothetical protein